MPGARAVMAPDGAEQTALLGAVRVRQLATELDLRPTKALGQNFVHDANTVRRLSLIHI